MFDNIEQVDPVRALANQAQRLRTMAAETKALNAEVDAAVEAGLQGDDAACHTIAARIAANYPDCAELAERLAARGFGV